MNAWLRSLNPRLPRSVQMLQLGGFFNAFGNGLVLPFTFIYLHNVRGISLGIAGLIVATNGVVSIAARAGRRFARRPFRRAAHAQRRAASS